MCYNVLCDKYATRQMYSYCPSWALNWDYRKKGILEEIQHYAADIINLQEVEMDQFYNFFMPELKVIVVFKVSEQILKGCFNRLRVTTAFIRLNQGRSTWPNPNGNTSMVVRYFIERQSKYCRINAPPSILPEDLTLFISDGR